MIKNLWMRTARSIASFAHIEGHPEKLMEDLREIFEVLGKRESGQLAGLMEKHLLHAKYGMHETVL